MTIPTDSKSGKPDLSFFPQSEVLGLGSYRMQIAEDYTLAEPEMLKRLMKAMESDPSLSVSNMQEIETCSRDLIAMMQERRHDNPVQELLTEYNLSSQEGVALMCLSEALLRIPDAATRDALIRDKICSGHWKEHLGEDPHSQGRSLFVNAATWGLYLTGALTSPQSKEGLTQSLNAALGKIGMPVIRHIVHLVMKLLGGQFVLAETIDDALEKSHGNRNRGYCYSFDMLGESALTAEQAETYTTAYKQAIHAIGTLANRSNLGSDLYDRDGISIKLSALYPRYDRLKKRQIMEQLAPRLLQLAELAKSVGIGICIDAEECEHLDMSLDLLEYLCCAPSLQGWDGLGFVVQTYQKRALAVLDYCIALARKTNRRLMIRLVKGAYWDSEIKHAQELGLEEFPVLTHKAHSDLSFLVCARKLLDALDAVFPQFATHNAQNLAAILTMAGPDFQQGQYEFQCLHGMGESLYDSLMQYKADLRRPVRIYAPVGEHDRLLAYLVRRLLENGSNSSFLNHISRTDATDILSRHPCTIVKSENPEGLPHPDIKNPQEIYGKDRSNSVGIDLRDERVSVPLMVELLKPYPTEEIHSADDKAVERAFETLASGQSAWAQQPVRTRAQTLRKAADLLEEKRSSLIYLLAHEARRIPSNGVSELREAVDFLRYYAQQAQQSLCEQDVSLGTVLCISPWNFPLAIFLGQIAAALAAGNTVLAKPAENTPRIALKAVALLHEAGVPKDALQILIGDGTLGAKLVAHRAVKAVLFTGSTLTARHISNCLGKRVLGPKPGSGDASPGHADSAMAIPLVAETGGRNCMIVDSSTLPEQAVQDVITSAFDSAGQRCSALRLLCVQRDVYHTVVPMIKGTMEQLNPGAAHLLDSDIGPVISDQAFQHLTRYIEEAKTRGFPIYQPPLPHELPDAPFVAPTLIEVKSPKEADREIFGPILHVLAYDRDDLDGLIDMINDAGFALTGGVHSRIHEVIDQVTQAMIVGNLYINRNIVGAIVGLQPFGGHGLSGTGPKAGGPLYIQRLVRSCHKPTSALDLCPDSGQILTKPSQQPLLARWIAFLKEQHTSQVQVDHAKRCARQSLAGLEIILPGQTGEENLYRLAPKGTLLCQAGNRSALMAQISQALATGNRVAIAFNEAPLGLDDLPPEFDNVIYKSKTLLSQEIDGVLFSGDSDSLLKLQSHLAKRPGAIIPVMSPACVVDGLPVYAPYACLQEQSISNNTAAVGGNVSLIALQEL